MRGIIDSGQKIITDQLYVHIDAAQLRSYPSTGTVWSDLSGNNVNSNLINGPTFSSEYGGSISCDGANDYVDFPFNVIPSAAMSVIVWARSATTNWNQDRCISRHWVQGHIIAPVINTKNVNYIISDRFANDYSIGTITLTNITIPHMYCITTNGSNSHKAYLDGIEVASISTSISRIAQTLGRQWNLGADLASSARRLNGYFYKSMMYNKELTATEVLQNYNADKSRFGL